MDRVAGVVEDWMYERVTRAYVEDPEMRAFYEQSNPWALRSMVERLLEADERGMWDATDAARKALHDALLDAEGWEERRLTLSSTYRDATTNQYCMTAGQFFDDGRRLLLIDLDADGL